MTVRIPAQAEGSQVALPVPPIRDLDYGSFRWVEIAQDDVTLLERAGIPFTPVYEAGLVQINRYLFDPVVEGEPQVPAELRASDDRGPEMPGLFLLQLSSPLRQEWQSVLHSRGIRLLQYYPHNTYLIWSTGARVAALAGRDLYRWSGPVHPAYKLSPDLDGRTGLVANVDVMFHDTGKLAMTLEAMENAGGRVLQHHRAQPDGAFWSAIVEIPAENLVNVARIDEVLWMGYQSPEPVLDDEMSSQTVAGNYDGSGVPQLGYMTWLGDIGYDGDGVIWSITDTGVDYNHPDLNTRIVGGHNYPGCVFTNPGDDPSGGGHGTHVAGIVGGDATGGYDDNPNGTGFLYGLGMAPGYSIFAQNPICPGRENWPPTGGWQELSKQGVLGGAIGANNSWTSNEGTAHGYQATERTHDFMARDGNFDTPAVAEPYILVFSAGNSGPGSGTLTSPKDAKNIIVTAGTQNYRVSSDIDAMYDSSSRGPAVDGRYVPTIAAPGERIASTRNDDGGSCGTAIPGTDSLYSYCTGTSMASPHAAGSVVLLTEWWRDKQGGGEPSPAMAKALLVNGAVDIHNPVDPAEAPAIPNFAEGWGRINLQSILGDGPDSVFKDQEVVLDNSGETFVFTVGIPDSETALKVTLAWSDAPGAVGANPALVNNLDLSVETDGTVYLGNDFSGGWSTTGGSADTLNNLENVFVQSPGSSATITVAATLIAGDGIPLEGDATDQDFAIICSNCMEEPDFLLDVVPASQGACSTTSMYTVQVGSLLNYTAPVGLSASVTPAGPTAVLGSSTVVPPGNTGLTVNHNGSPVGSYEIEVTGTSTSGVHTDRAMLHLYDMIPAQVILVSPDHNVVNSTLTPTFEWSSLAQVAAYEIQIALDAAFSQMVDSSTDLVDTTYTPASPLPADSSLYWRVRAVNACGTGTWSITRRLNTQGPGGTCGPGSYGVFYLNDNFESGAPGWTHQGTGDTWGLSTARAQSGTYSFHADDPSSLSDQLLLSPEVSIAASAPDLRLKFWNHQTIEDSSTGCYDAGVVEVSTDGGSSWSEIPAALILNAPYDGLVSTQYSNPIGGREAWCGDPRDWAQTIIDLSSYAGQSIVLGFRLASDSLVGREGWYVDDVLLGYCQLPFFADGFESGDTSAWQ